MSGMKDLFGDRPYELPQPKPEKAFDGDTYEPNRDHIRLKGQLLRVYTLMADGRWRTLAEIAEQASGSQAAVSARLRDLRKEKYGSHTVERIHLGSGLFKYRLLTGRLLVTNHATI